MTVAELIVILQNFPPDMQIVYFDDVFGYQEVLQVTESRAWLPSQPEDLVVIS